MGGYGEEASTGAGRPETLVPMIAHRDQPASPCSRLVSGLRSRPSGPSRHRPGHAPGGLSSRRSLRYRCGGSVGFPSFPEGNRLPNYPCGSRRSAPRTIVSKQFRRTSSRQMRRRFGRKRRSDSGVRLQQNGLSHGTSDGDIPPAEARDPPPRRGFDMVSRLGRNRRTDPGRSTGARHRGNGLASAPRKTPRRVAGCGCYINRLLYKPAPGNRGEE